MKQLIQIGKLAPGPSVRDMFQQLAQREADEIRRLKQALSERTQH
jgi:hypothetical protein